MKPVPSTDTAGNMFRLAGFIHALEMVWDRFDSTSTPAQLGILESIGEAVRRAHYGRSPLPFD